jgi:superfamily II DNA or RNA helicase
MVCINQVNELQPVYFSNEENIVKSLFLPICQSSYSFSCMSGYFSSNVISELAEPLVYLFANEGATGRFLISPHLNEEDKQVILESYNQKESFFEKIFNLEVTESFLAKQTLDALKYLISAGRIDIRIVLMNEGMMHAKIWVFETEFGKTAIHGSGNATYSGLMRNFEQLVLSREWDSQQSFNIIEAYESRFIEFWDGKRNDSITLQLNDKTLRDIYSSTTSQVSKIDFAPLLEEIKGSMNEIEMSGRLSIPSWLDYEHGDYKHQGEAIKNWLANDFKGTLEIATGGGKTLTSLVCAVKALSQHKKAILVVAVPTKPLIKQWANDIEKFGIKPMLTEGISSKNIRKILTSAFRKQRILGGHDVIVITHDALKNSELMSVFDKYDGVSMVIGDEAHNLGAISFVQNPPDFFKYRLALSATPERQYDEQGTQKLMEYFGEVVFQFTLKEAIGKCLVPFEYYLHTAYLDDEEQCEWDTLTDKINNLRWNEDYESQELVKKYLIMRRAISEGAKDKITVLTELLNASGSLKYSLVFCSSKGPEQLNAVNEVLDEKRISYHQITKDETANKTLMQKLIETYTLGHIDVLTSKKVLDEGFNIPPIKLAIFLASSGVTRTWVQRLGRVLRQCDETGKTHAVVHDIAVLPLRNDQSTRPLLESELARMQWFADHSKNALDPKGSAKVINHFINTMEGI